MVIHYGKIKKFGKPTFHASVLVTLDSYGTYHDQLVISNINMIREKLVAKNKRFELRELIHAQDELVQNFIGKNHRN